jgi:hypothetical protein
MHALEIRRIECQRRAIIARDGERASTPQPGDAVRNVPEAWAHPEPIERWTRGDKTGCQPAARRDCQAIPDVTVRCTIWARLPGSLSR